MTMFELPARRFLTRARAVQIVCGAAVAIAASWAAFGLPVPASKAHVAAELGGVRIDALEARQDIAEMRLFLIDWTLRDVALDRQARALLEAERSRVQDRKVSINARLEQARATR